MIAPSGSAKMKPNTTVFGVADILTWQMLRDFEFGECRSNATLQKSFNSFRGRSPLSNEQRQLHVVAMANNMVVEAKDEAFRRELLVVTG